MDRRIFSSDDFFKGELFASLLKQIDAYLEENYKELKKPGIIARLRSMIKGSREDDRDVHITKEDNACQDSTSPSVMWSSRELDELMVEMRQSPKPETFSRMLIRLINEAGMTHAECYQKAQVSKQVFSRIQSDEDYHPAKGTVLAFALALSLPLEKAEELLKKAGYALSSSQKADVIVKFAFLHKIYDVIKVNEFLFHYDEKLLP